MKHYICTGSCAGEWQKPGLCDSRFCSNEGQALIECSCEDGAHENAGEKADSEDIGM